MKTILTTAVLALAALNSQANTTDFTVVNGVSDPGQFLFLTIQESKVEDFAYDFVVTNVSKTGIVTGIYFEEDWTRKLKGVGTPSGPAEYRATTFSPDIDGWKGPMGSHTVAYDTVEHMLQRGVFSYTHHNRIEDGLARGQSQVFSFVTDTSIISLENLHNALATEGYGVAVQMQGLLEEDPEAPSWLLANAMPAGGGGFGGGGGSVQAVPTPGAAAGVALAGLAGICRRRRR